MDFDLEPVGDEAHDAGRFHPGNLFELCFLQRQRDEENIASDIGAHDFHDLRLGNILHAADFNVVAGFHAKAPGALTVLVQGGGGDCGHAQNRSREGCPQESTCSLFGKRAAAGRDTLLPAQEGRFLVYIQVHQARVLEFLARRLGAGWVQLLLQDGAAGFPRHQSRFVVAKESLSFFNIASFLELR